MTALKAATKPQIPSRIVTDIALLSVFSGFLFFFGLSYFGLVGADEPRYAQVAREMLNRRDWITPTLTGKPWLEKPPLYYWQAIVAYRIFGVSDWAARLPSAVDATLVVVAVYLFLRCFRPGFHLDGALVTASAAGVIGFARAASTDMPLAAMFTIAMLAWYAWYESRSHVYLAQFYFSLALAALAKGPIAVLLALLIIAVYAALKHEFAILRQTFWIWGIALFMAVALPWYVAVQLRNPDFFRVFILQHNLARFGTNLYHHPEPFWYYVPVVMLALLPWTAFVIVALSEDISAQSRKKQEPDHSDDLSLYLTIWLIVPIVFFSLSQSKLPGYIVPTIPAGSLLVAEYIRRHSAKNESAHIWGIVTHSLVASAALVPALMIRYILLQHRVPRGRAALTPLAFAAVMAIAIALTLKFRGLRLVRFATLVPVVLVVGVVLREGAPALDSTLSGRPLANEIARFQPGSKSQIAVFEVARETEFGLAFYLDRPISRYERREIPSAEHILIAPAGSQNVVASSLAGRRVSYLGTFSAQAVDYFWVSGDSIQHSALSNHSEKYQEATASCELNADCCLSRLPPIL
jgi:4-amino-4-deoxy-L-arabinose transferase-like glycosyltransferase